MTLRTRIAHLLEKFFLDPVAAYVVIEYADFDTLLCLADQRLLKTGTRFIVTKNIIENVNMVAGLFDLFEQGGHLGSPVAVMGQAAAVKGNRLRSIGKQSGQGLTCGRNGGIASTHMGRKSIDHEPLVGTARNNPLAPQILPEEEIENQSHDRSENQHDDPRDRLERVAVAQNDNQDDADNRRRIDGDEQICQELQHRGGGLSGFRRDCFGFRICVPGCRSI